MANLEVSELPYADARGLSTSALTASALVDGPMTGARFRGSVEHTLVPALGPSDTVALDNLPAHKVSGI